MISDNWYEVHIFVFYDLASKSLLIWTVEGNIATWPDQDLWFPKLLDIWWTNNTVILDTRQNTNGKADFGLSQLD